MASHLVQELSLAQELATLSMQAVVTFDDFDDKLEGSPDFTGIDREEVKRVLRSLRRVMDKAHDVRNDVKSRLKEAVQQPPLEKQAAEQPPVEREEEPESEQTKDLEQSDASRLSEPQQVSEQ